MKEYKRLTHRNNKCIEEYCEEEHCPYSDKYVCRIDESTTLFNVDEDCAKAMIERLAELEDKIENGTLIELEKPYIKQQSNGLYIVCIAQEVGVTMAVKTKAQAEEKLKELKEV